MQRTEAPDACPLPRNLPPVGPPWRRWGTAFGYVLAFLLLATFSLSWALGYRINWAAASVEQTAVLELSSPQVGINPRVYVNGVLQPGSLPQGLRWLFPGRYEVVVQADGYQPWVKLVELKANQRVSFAGIILIYTEPKPVAVPGVRIDELLERQQDSRGIDVRAGNELWVRNMFITRSSRDIVNPEWYGDRSHVVYQQGAELVLRDLDSQSTQTLMTLKSENPVPYVVRENGRILVVAEEGALRAVELFQPSSIIDRFSP